MRRRRSGPCRVAPQRSCIHGRPFFLLPRLHRHHLRRNIMSSWLSKHIWLCVGVCVCVCVCVTSPLTLSRLSLLSTNPRRNTFSVCQSACVCCSTLFAGYLPEACELDYMLLIVCAYRPSSGSAGNYWMYAAGFQLLASFFSPYPLSSRSFNFS